MHGNCVADLLADQMVKRPQEHVGRDRGAASLPDEEHRHDGREDHEELGGQEEEHAVTLRPGRATGNTAGEGKGRKR